MSGRPTEHTHDDLTLDTAAPRDTVSGEDRTVDASMGSMS